MNDRTYTAQEVALERAALLREMTTKFRKYLDSCPEDHSSGSAQRLGITVCIEAAETIPTDQSALARVEAEAYERGKRDAKITIADLSRHPISYALGIVEEAIDALQDRGREADAGERWEEADTKKALDVIDRDFKR